MDDYPSNSHKSKTEKGRTPPEKKIGKVVTGEVITAKKSAVRKFADSLVSGGIENVRDYIVDEIVMPKVKDVISDSVGSLCDNLKNGVDTLLYGKEGRKDSRIVTSYGGYYSNGYDQRRERRGSYANPDIILKYRGDAEAVLSEMRQVLSLYHVVSIADVCEMVDILPNSTDNNYGWSDLSGAHIVRVRKGYKLELPRAIPLD